MKLEKLIPSDERLHILGLVVITAILLATFGYEIHTAFELYAKAGGAQ